MDRRSFVTGSALGAFGLASAGMFAGAAMADQTAAAPVAAGTAENTVAQAGSNPAWLGEEPEIDAADIVATYQCDILIVGGAGNGGLAAAATASDLGLNFIAVDRAQSVTESREYLGAINSTYSTQVREMDGMQMLNEISRYASGKCDRDLIKLWIDNSAEVVDWLDPMLTAAGKFCSVADPGEHATGGTEYVMPVCEHSWVVPYQPPTRNDVLLEHIQAQGDDIWFGYELVRLVHADGKVTGGIFKCEDGYVEIDAPYVVLATGGYPANPVMMQALQPDACRVMTAASYNAFCDGSGIKCGLWAGASKQADPTPMLFDRGAVPAGVVAGYVGEGADSTLPGKIYQLNIGSQPFLKVNRDGKRFANESTPYDNMLFATRRQPGGVFCQVFDGNCDPDIVRFSMIGCASYTTAMVRDAGFTAEEFISMDGGDGLFVKADTLEELADKLGFEGDAKDTFLATCERYNELFDAQKDDDYGKEDYRLSELRTPPFYGCWYGASLLGTLDGLNINAKMQVLDADYNVVPGLYAAGDASGSFFYTNYPEYIPGLAACRSVTEGRQCVKMIAEDAGLAAGAEKTQVEAPVATPAVADCADGTYTGSAEGIGGTLNVTVEISGGKLTVTEIGPNYETPRYPGYGAIENGTFVEQIEAAQSDQIDGVTMATVTTGAIKRALRDALLQAAK